MLEFEPIGQTKDGQDFTAWLLTCNPEVWDGTEWFAEHDRVDDWKVADNYRSEMMAPGDLCFLWIGGRQSPTHTPGIWAAGVVTGPCLYETTAEGELWGNGPATGTTATFIDVDLRRLDDIVPRDAIHQDPRLADAEIIKTPQQANPQVLRPHHVAALVEAIPELEATLESVYEGELMLRDLAEQFADDCELGTVGFAIRDPEIRVKHFFLHSDAEADADRFLVVSLQEDAGRTVIAEPAITIAKELIERDLGGVLTIVGPDPSDPDGLAYDILDPWDPDAPLPEDSLETSES